MQISRYYQCVYVKVQSLTHSLFFYIFGTGLWWKYSRARKLHSSYCPDEWFWVQDKWTCWNL